MADTNASGGAKRRRGPVKLAELVGKIIDPVTARRGFATSNLIASWSEIVGARTAASSRPDRIVWPKGTAQEGKAALLVLRVDGPRAVFIQHESGQIIERVNAFLGYAAIGQIRIVQAPLGGATEMRPRPPSVSQSQEARLSEAVAGVENEGLRAALARLGRGVLADKSR